MHNRIGIAEESALDEDLRNNDDKRGSNETILRVLYYAFVEIRAIC